MVVSYSIDTEVCLNQYNRINECNQILYPGNVKLGKCGTVVGTPVRLNAYNV